jgi:hypothetical protein
MAPSSDVTAPVPEAPDHEVPARTNPFQQLIMLIEEQLAPGAVVRESAPVLDNKTGKPREVDVLIETVSGVHPIRIAVECQDRSRPATEEWIDQLHGKYRDLDVDKVVAVARKGFTAGARAKAEAVGIRTLSLIEADAADWQSEIAAVDEIEGFEVDVTIEDMALTVDDENDPMIQRLPTHALELHVYDSEGRALGSVAEVIARSLLKQPDVSERVAQTLDAEPVKYMSAVQLTNAFLHDELGGQQPLHAARAQLMMKARRRATALVERSDYADAHVVHGTITLGGKRISLALVAKPGSGASVGFRHS